MAVVRKAGAGKRQMAARAAVVGANRGYLRTGGFYGRFRGRRAGGPASSELKFFDTTLANTNVVTTGTVNPNLVIIPQDDTESGRIGRKVTIKSIWVKGTVFMASAAAATNTSDATRLMLVQDKQANGAAFTVAQVLAQISINGFRNLENENRFRVLWDTTIRINQNGGLAAATFEQARQFSKYIKCNIPIEYDSTASTGAIGTQRSNSLAILMLNHEADNASVVQYRARVRYSDN